MASQTPKSASQRLLTMKFMQRAAAATPEAPSTPTPDHEQPSKRRKTSGRATLGAPEKQQYVIDRKAAQAALEEDERKRQALVAKHAEALGDSHWVLDTGKLPGSQQNSAPLKIVQVGFSQIDRGGGAGAEVPEDNEDTITADGPTFRSFGPKKEAAKKDDANSSGSSSDDASQRKRKKPGQNDHGSQQRPEIRTRNSAERERAQRLAKERRKKEVKLNTLTSISGSGSSNFSRPNAPGRRR
ncbi:hypothetical protein VPNG_05947 [Cytospora leucostoma]|uniref:Uncharacterized protein n=1 Tax=Cytospora leucostoma TaxID=1230097 RepID=A0A423XAY6_9PEZI|nr:hypothetical protein VPNG_05947 [Cytospora leucostoma]